MYYYKKIINLISRIKLKIIIIIIIFTTFMSDMVTRYKITCVYQVFTYLTYEILIQKTDLKLNMKLHFLCQHICVVYEAFCPKKRSS